MRQLLVKQEYRAIKLMRITKDKDNLILEELEFALEFDI